MHLNLLLERQSVCRYNGKNFRKHFKIVHMIDFKDSNFCRHTFSLIEKVETQWEGLEYLVIGKVLERRLWQLEIFFFCQRSTFNFDKIKEFQKKCFSISWPDLRTSEFFSNNAYLKDICRKWLELENFSFIRFGNFAKHSISLNLKGVCSNKRFKIFKTSIQFFVSEK